MHILLTNDDGIFASGLRALYKALIKDGHTVAAVAPMTNQSGVGHAITVLSPLRVQEVQEKDFTGLGVFGTPSDCVKLGLSELVEKKPDMVISGMNIGANVGSDIQYSGTVAAAAEAAHLSFPSFAVSYDSYTEKNVDAAAEYAVGIIKKISTVDFPLGRVLNLNLPARPVSEYLGLKLCAQEKITWRDWYQKRIDPRGEAYWWLDGTIPEDKLASDSDRGLLSKGYVTLTPLCFEFTDYENFSMLHDIFTK